MNSFEEKRASGKCQTKVWCCEDSCFYCQILFKRGDLVLLRILQSRYKWVEELFFNCKDIKTPAKRFKSAQRRWSFNLVQRNTQILKERIFIERRSYKSFWGKKSPTDVSISSTSCDESDDMPTGIG